MKILIVDDEVLGQQRLHRMITGLGYTDITIVENGETALHTAASKHFDVAFLDIQMPGISGIELGYELRYHYPDMFIIFQTAYNDHALQAFEIGAVDYLIKPYSVEQLSKTFERITTPREPQDTLRLLTKNGENFYLFKPEDIYYIKADLAEVMVRTDRGFSYCTKKISDLEYAFKPFDFFRIHRSYIINIDKIKEMESIEQSKLRFSFDGIKDQVESSKDGAKLFRNTFST